MVCRVGLELLLTWTMLVIFWQVQSVTARRTLTAGNSNAALAANTSQTGTLPLPTQNLFPHGRQCGLQNATHTDKTAAKGVQLRFDIAEGELDIPVWCLLTTAIASALQ